MSADVAAVFATQVTLCAILLCEYLDCHLHAWVSGASSGVLHQQCCEPRQCVPGPGGETHAHAHTHTHTTHTHTHTRAPKLTLCVCVTL